MPPAAIDMSGPALASGSPQKRKKISGEGDFVKGAIGTSFGLLCVFVVWVEEGWTTPGRGSCTISPLTTPCTHRALCSLTPSLPTYPNTHRDATALHFIHSFLQCV